MSPTTGQQAPDFTLYTDEKKAWTLSEQNAPVLLLFFPGAFTSVCTTELNAVNNDLSRYNDAGVNVVGISTDSPFVLAEFKKAQGLTFPLLSDHDGDVAKRYGTKYSRDFTPMQFDRIAKRSAFLVSYDGHILYAEVLDNAGEMPDFEAIHARMANMMLAD